MPQQRTRQRGGLGFAAIGGLALVWGYNWVVMKLAVQDCPPFLFAAIRSFVGGVVLLVLVASRRRPASLRPPWPAAVYGLLQTGTTGFGIWALQMTGAGKVSVLTYTMPFWLLLLAWPILGEKIQGLQWLTVFLAATGLVFVVIPWRLSDLWASFLALVGAVGWALASVFYKLARQRYIFDLLSFTAWQVLFGSLPLVLVSLLTVSDRPQFTVTFIGAVVFNVFVASSLAMFLWILALENLPAGTAGISSLAVPVVGVLAAWLHLGEKPTFYEALGTALILAALSVLTVREMLASRKRT